MCSPTPPHAEAKDVGIAVDSIVRVGTNKAGVIAGYLHELAVDLLKGNIALVAET